MAERFVPHKDAEKKHSVRYEAQDENASQATMYVSRSWLETQGYKDGAYPSIIELTADCKGEYLGTRTKL